MKLSDHGVGLKERQRRASGGCRVKPPQARSETPIEALSSEELWNRYLASESGSTEATFYAAAIRARSQFRSLN